MNRAAFLAGQRNNEGYTPEEAILVQMEKKAELPGSLRSVFSRQTVQQTPRLLRPLAIPQTKTQNWSTCCLSSQFRIVFLVSALQQ